MIVSRPVTATVRIHGVNDNLAPGEKLDEATGSTKLKVGNSMLVTLSSLNDPAAFKIEPDPNTKGAQMLPADGYTNWNWTVTPNVAGKLQKLQIDAFIVLDGNLPDGSLIKREVRSATVLVVVEVKPSVEVVEDFVAENWKDLLKYILPGGGGVALIVWLLRRGRLNETKKREDESEENEDD
jgi:hypothetical protein